MTYEDRGTILSFNKQGETCGGGLPLFDCDTVKELGRQSLTIAVPGDDFSEGVWWSGNGNTDMSCQNCGMHCGVALKSADGIFTEEAVYTFTAEHSPIDDFANPPEQEG